MPTVVTLTPDSYEAGIDPIGPIEATDAPTISGDVTDSSDDTYFRLQAMREVGTGDDRAGILKCVYKLSPAMNPFALLWQYRMRTPQGTVANPPASPPDIFVVAVDQFGGTLDEFGYNAGVVEPLATMVQEDPEWFTWAFIQVPDMNNPSDAGFWIADWPEFMSALTSDEGLTLHLFPYQPDSSAGSGNAVDYLDVFEARLIVACNPGRKPKLRVFPRDDLNRVYPQPRSRQGSNRVAGSTYL